MQIILVQTEIEEAIKDYVNKCLTVTEGTDIGIDLSSTRGPEGIKAIINLVPSAPKTAQVPAGLMKRVPKAVSVLVASDPAQTDKSSTLTNITAMPAAVETVEEQVPVESLPEQQNEVIDETPQNADVTVPAALPVKSLFANLRKPVNQ